MANYVFLRGHLRNERSNTKEQAVKIVEENKFDRFVNFQSRRNMNLEAD